MLASSIVRDARRAGLTAETITPVGGLRRFAPDVGGVALLGVVPASRQRHILHAFARLPVVLSVGRETEQSVTVTTGRGTVQLFLTTPADAGTALVWHTGSDEHTRLLTARAETLGLRFSDGILTSADGQRIPCATEAEFYERLGLSLIPPELRHGTDEIAAAVEHRLPPLIADRDIRGDLHTHSTWSDGQNSIADMVSAAKQIGYEFIAITDHSERAFCSRRLSRPDIPRQRREVDELRARVSGIEIFHGVEVDILSDGTLDFEDDLLTGFDVVLASLHDHNGQDGRQLTERYLRVIDHPLVNIITHPANRSPGHSPGYDLEYDRLFAAAAESGTALEIDGAPGHLDLDGELARQAVQAGVTLTVDSDCHRVEALARQMQFGVGTARRGWVEPRHVLNTRSATEVRQFIARKRSRGR
jgi:DNA polymerase (family 10)